ncbi:hypothetical protein WP1_231 [Pseudomonas phage WP1]
MGLNFTCDTSYNDQVAEESGPFDHCRVGNPGVNSGSVHAGLWPRSSMMTFWS